MTIPFVKTITATLQKHPLWIGGTIAVAIVLWVGLIGYTYVLSPAPTEDEIAQQTVRVNEAGLSAISVIRTTYRQPYELPTLSENHFRPSPAAN